MLVAEEGAGVWRPHCRGLALAVRVRAFVPDATADTQLVPTFAPAAGNDARVRRLAIRRCLPR